MYFADGPALPCVHGTGAEFTRRIRQGRRARSMIAAAEHAVLASGLVDAVTKLGWYGEETPLYLEAPSDHEVVPTHVLLAPENLRGYFLRAIRAWSVNPESENQRAAASRFMRRYCGSLVVAALVPLAHGLGVDVAPSRVSLLMRQDMPMGVVLDLSATGLRTSVDRPPAWPVTADAVPTVAQLRAEVLRTLFADNLVPAINRVVTTIPMMPSVIWATVAEAVDLVHEKAQDTYDSGPLAALREDRAAILFAETVPGIDGPNPMLGVLDWETFDDPESPRPHQLRNVCCLCYLIPGRRHDCWSCPRLQPEERLDAWRTATHR